jgi:hypothetical protein
VCCICGKENDEQLPAIHAQREHGMVSACSENKKELSLVGTYLDEIKNKLTKQHIRIIEKFETAPDELTIEDWEHAINIVMWSRASNSIKPEEGERLAQKMKDILKHII